MLIGGLAAAIVGLAGTLRSARHSQPGDDSSRRSGGTPRTVGCGCTNQSRTDQTMSKNTQEVRDDANALVKDAHALLAATANVAEETVVEARHRLESALARGKELCGHARDQAVAGARATDHAVHAPPYQAIGLAVGAGVLVGYLLSRRCCCHREQTASGGGCP
jgi:ElaB/YqjD/DUF883 family membrane-anchored ribosome-binding protein